VQSKVLGMWMPKEVNFLVALEDHYNLCILYLHDRPRRDEVKEEWRRLHNEELNDLYSLPNIVQVIKSRRMRWAGHLACMGEDRGGV